MHSITGPAGADIQACITHLLDRLADVPTGTVPFRHLYLEKALPTAFYQAFHAFMLDCKYGRDHQDRPQDNPEFTNRRFNLAEARDDVTSVLRALFSDAGVKQTLLEKFYVAPPPALTDDLVIHEEFEFFFTKAGRFQNIHVDIPPKYLSFVFYLPEHSARSEEEEKRNATILYDKTLTPHYAARFVPNSVCIFAPHFHSYHGFSSTIDRDVLVMFYVLPDAMEEWRQMRTDGGDTTPFDGIRNQIEEKLRRYPLVEFSDLRAARDACLVNAPQGRVLAEAETDER